MKRGLLSGKAWFTAPQHSHRKGRLGKSSMCRRKYRYSNVPLCAIIDIALKLLDRKLLLGDDPFDDIAKRYNPD